MSSEAKTEEAGNRRADDKPGPPDAGGTKGKFEEAVDDLRPVEKFLFPIHPPSPSNPSGGELWLFPAGWRASKKPASEANPTFDDRFSKYAATVQDFGWSDFYARYEGQAFFDWFRSRLLAGPPPDLTLSENVPRRGFDVILIDSRTGVTEVGGVCTRQLADVVVSFCAPNYQNLTGAERMSESFATKDLENARGKRPLEVVVIPARVDEAGETDAQNRFRSQFVKVIKTPAALQESISSSWQLLVPYVTKYAYQESLAIAVADSNQKLEQAYKKLASHLVLLSPLESRLRTCLSTEIQALRKGRPRAYILYAEPADETTFNLKSRLPGVELTGDIADAESLVVSFSQPTLLPEIKQQIRNCRQRGVCVYGFRRSASATVPALLRNSSIYEDTASLDELVEKLRTPCQRRRAPFMVPNLTPGWVFRPDIMSRLKSLFLEQAKGKSPVVVIRSPVGFGATTLAAGLCFDEEILDHFIDGIFWVNAGGNVDLLACLNAIGSALTGESAKFESVSEATARLGQRLAGTTALLVVDDLAREGDLIPFRTLPVALLTTVGQAVPVKDAVEVTLGRMSHAEAVQAITSLAQSVSAVATIPAGPGIERLAYRLAHWPLALSLAKAPLAQLNAKGLDAESAANSLADDIERGDFSSFGDSARMLLKESRRQIAAALNSLPERDREVFYSLKPLINTPSFPIDSFPGRWTLGEEAFSLIQTLAREGLIETDSNLKTIELSAFAAQYLREFRIKAESKHTVFVLRPFGNQANIDFDAVERDLIAPALEELGIRGVTGTILEGGNIRKDILGSLLSADLVIADVSLPNSNVFYQLGVRHALREKRTFLIRSTTAAGPDSLPDFDLRTDRFVAYDGRNPAQALNSFASGLRATLASDGTDSPMFLILPNLVPLEPAQAVPVPSSFSTDVDEAERGKSVHNLRLFSMEVRDMPWALPGLRRIGRAQFHLRAFADAALTWEEVRRSDVNDKEANLLLGTVYQRLDDFAASDACLQRLSGRPNLSDSEHAETFALMARNSKARWQKEWRQEALPKSAEIALRSPMLSESIKRYGDALEQDPHSHYAALNALALLAVQIELAKIHPEVWADRFDTDEEANVELARLERERSLVAAAAELALRSAERSKSDDFWIRLSRADLTLYTSGKGKRVAFAYRQALEGAPPFAVDSVRNQLLMLLDLRVMADSVQSVLDSFPAAAELNGGQAAKNKQRAAILFAGHAIDRPDRKEPRFPADAETQVRGMMKESLVRLISNAPAPADVVGLAGGSAGADIIFHELCQELGVPSILCLPYPAQEYVSSSVQYAGADWVGRFNRLLKTLEANVRVLSSSAEMPKWLSSRTHYSVWQRNILWMFGNATGESSDHVRVMALWDGRQRAGYGGVSDFIHQAQARSMATEVLTISGSLK